MSENKDGWAGTIKGRPNVGQAAERTRTTSAKDIAAFTDMTGDRNPVHYDRALAEKTSFGKLIVQGGVTTGILNAVVAEDLPGPGTVFLGVEWKFLKAVGVDEAITGRVEIAEVRADKPICKLITEVRDGQGNVCVSGTATTYTMPLLGL
jgi:acyl dehydratase